MCSLGVRRDRSLAARSEGEGAFRSHLAEVVAVDTAVEVDNRRSWEVEESGRSSREAVRTQEQEAARSLHSTAVAAMDRRTVCERSVRSHVRQEGR